MHTSFYRATQAMFDTEEPTTPSDFGCVVVGTGSGWMMLHCAESENAGLEALGAEGESVEMTVPLGDTTEGDEMLDIDAETGKVIWRASHQYWGG